MAEERSSHDVATVAVHRLEKIAEVLTLLSLGEKDSKQLRISVEQSDELSVVETAINLFVREFSGLKSENEANTREQQQLVRTIEDQQSQIEKLSSPLIEIERDIVALPVIGRLDAERCDRILSLVLEWVTTNGSRYVVVDLTGLVVADGSSSRLLGLAKAVRLVGADLIFSGVRPELAVMLASSGEDLVDAKCARTLHQALNMIRRSHRA